MKRSLLALLVVGLFLGCSHLTIAPKPVAVHEITFDTGEQTAGILDYDSTGLIVTPGWVQRYDALVAEYGKKLPVEHRVKSGDRTGIVATTYKGRPAFHVYFEVNSRYADLKYFERNAGP